MSKYSLIGISVLALGLATAADARGGRGGFGGAPGGGFRPSPPAVSRPVARPAPHPAPGPRPDTRPVTPRPGGPGGPGRPGVGTPGVGGPGGVGPGPIRPIPGGPVTRPGGRPNAGDIAGSIGRHPAGHLPGTPGHRPGNGFYHKTEMTVNIHNHFRVRPGVGYPLGAGWYGAAHWHYTRWPYWAAAATGAAIANWLTMPPYGGYGSSETIVYYPVESAPVEIYEQQVTEVTQVVSQGSGQDVPADSEWLNLGNFGLIPVNQKDFSFTIQLAFLSDGTLRGMQWNMADQSTTELEGSIDKDTQRIAWQAKGQPDAPYFETTIDQITQEESLINVYDPRTKSLVSWQVIQINSSDLPPSR
jgi:hypothetical protein